MDIRRCRCQWRIIVLWAGILVIVAMCLVPPWVREGGPDYFREDAGYSLMWRWPVAEGKEYGHGQIYLDTSRLVVQCLVVALLTAGVLATPWLKAKLDSGPERELPQIKPEDLDGP